VTRRTYVDAAREQAEGRLRAEYEAGRVDAHPSRITAALNARALYGPEVDTACGVLEPAVDEWEAGTRRPTWEQLVALAALTDFPVGFFFRAPARRTGPIFLCSRTKQPSGERCTVIPPDAAAPVPVVDEPSTLF
jgi:hypothetical protein